MLPHPLGHVKMSIGSGPATSRTMSEIEIGRTCATARARLGRGSGAWRLGSSRGPGEIDLSREEGSSSSGTTVTVVQNQNQNSMRRREQKLQNDYFINILLILSLLDLFNGHLIVGGQLKRQSGCSPWLQRPAAHTGR